MNSTNCSVTPFSPHWLFVRFNAVFNWPPIKPSTICSVADCTPLSRGTSGHLSTSSSKSTGLKLIGETLAKTQTEIRFSPKFSFLFLRTIIFALQSPPAPHYLRMNSRPLDRWSSNRYGDKSRAKSKSHHKLLSVTQEYYTHLHLVLSSTQSLANQRVFQNHLLVGHHIMPRFDTCHSIILTCWHRRFNSIKFLGTNYPGTGTQLKPRWMLWLKVHPRWHWALIDSWQKAPTRTCCCKYEEI